LEAPLQSNYEEPLLQHLFESIEESRATSTATLSVVPHEHARAASPVTCSNPTRGLGTAISARLADDESTGRDLP